MSTRNANRRPLARYLPTPNALAPFAIILSAACGGSDGSGGPVTPPPAQGFSIAASVSALSVTAGANGSLMVTLTRTGAFTGAVSLSATGLPVGVTASFNPAQIAAGQTTTTLTLTAVASAPAGTTTLTVRGSASGLPDQTITAQLTILAALAQTGPFTLSVSASSYLLLPSNHLGWSPVVTITRNPGFTGPVALSVSGLPPTLFLPMTPTNVTGTTATMLPLNGGAPNGTYTATIRGVAAGLGERSITMQLVVAPTSTGNIRWKYCSTSTPRWFFAVKDGNGPWTRIMPSTDSVYAFNISAATGQVAEVTIDSGGFRTTIHQYTAQEMAARAASNCQLYPNGSTRSAHGSFGGVTGFRTSQVGMGYWFGSANGNGSFTMLNLPPGPLDVITARNTDIVTPHAIGVDRAIIRRGVNPGAGGTMPTFRFDSTESFSPTTSTWTFGNVNGEPFSVAQLFTTVGGSTVHFTGGAYDGAPVVRTLYGIPQAQTLAGDLHQVIATVSTVGPTPGSVLRASRQVIAYSRTIADRTLSFGPGMPASNVTSLGGGRLRAQGTVPTEYQSGVTFDVTQTTTGRFATIHASRGFLGAGTNYDLQIPDLSGAIGWDTQFPLRTGVATNWWVSGGGPVLDVFDARYIFNSTRSRWAGALTGIQAPADGATYLMARTVGVTTP